MHANNHNGFLNQSPGLKVGPFRSILSTLTSIYSLWSPCWKLAPAWITGSGVCPPARSSVPYLIIHILHDSTRRFRVSPMLHSKYRSFRKPYGTESLGRSFDGPRSPTEEEPGKGRALQGTTSGTTGKKPTLDGLTTFKIVGKLLKRYIIPI